MRRDRAQTEQRLLDAVGQIIAEDGFDQLGINRIANRAGIHKILIYRYFGGLDGLLKTYFSRNRPIISIPSIDVARLKGASLEEFFDICYQYLIATYRMLNHNPEAQQFLRIDLLSSDGLANPILIEREKYFQHMVDELADVIQTEYGRPFAAIMMSSVSLLTLLGRQKRNVLGIDLSSEEGQHQIEMAYKNIMDGMYLFTKKRLEESGEKLT